MTFDILLPNASNNLRNINVAALGSCNNHRLQIVIFRKTFFRSSSSFISRVVQDPVDLLEKKM